MLNQLTTRLHGLGISSPKPAFLMVSHVQKEELWGRGISGYEINCNLEDKAIYNTYQLT